MIENETDAFAKVNLALDVIRRRPDGYHDIKSVMHSVKLHDTVYLKRTGAGISVECDSSHVPQGADNIAFKAALVMAEHCGIKDGIEIHIKKRIPVSAGLAGGSADAAAVLRGMNEMFSLGLTAERLVEIGRNIGADVPFCIMGGTALAEGIGDILTVLEGMPELNMIIVKPDVCISTAWAYGNLDLTEIRERPDIGALIEAVGQRDVSGIAAKAGNVFESLVLRKYPEVGAVKEKLLESGAIGSVMSGSGPSVLGIYKDADAMETACDDIFRMGMQCYAQFADRV